MLVFSTLKIGIIRPIGNYPLRILDNSLYMDPQFHNAIIRSKPIPGNRSQAFREEFLNQFEFQRILIRISIHWLFGRHSSRQNSPRI